MMLFYASIPVAFLLAVWALSRRNRFQSSEESISKKDTVPGIAKGGWLQLSERLFDPSDERWLVEELNLPNLARTLTVERKRLAIYWLETLQASFDALVRTPEFSAGETPETDSAGSWKILWLTVRFKIAISYALLVVKSFGPYNRLIPSFSWIPFSRRSERSFRRPALANSRSSH